MSTPNSAHEYRGGWNSRHQRKASKLGRAISLDRLTVLLHSQPPPPPGKSEELKQRTA
jgi:hypothetical protein